MLITKHDFSPLVKFTANINDADINPFILKAQRSLPVLAEGTYDIFASYNLPADTYPLFEAKAPTPAESFREHNGIIWQAVIETTTIPTEENTDWLAMPEYTVFNLGIKPYLVFKAYDFLLPIHGIDVTQAGLTQQTGDGYSPISDSRRKEIIASNRSDLHNAEADLDRYLKEYGYLPKPTSCNPAGNRPRFGLGVAKNTYR